MKHWMSSAVETVAPCESLEQAAHRMWTRDVGFLPVVEGERVVGALTDRDVCMGAFTRGIALRGGDVAPSASRHLVAVAPDSSVEAALKLMGRRQVRRLPVVDPDGRLLGVLSLGDVVREVARFPEGPERARWAERLLVCMSAIARAPDKASGANHELVPALPAASRKAVPAAAPAAAPASAGRRSSRRS